MVGLALICGSGNIGIDTATPRQEIALIDGCAFFGCYLKERELARPYRLIAARRVAHSPSRL
jgi:hypothetical protein